MERNLVTQFGLATIVVAFAAMGVASPACAAYKAECPPRVLGESIKFEGTPSGWTPHAPSFLRAESVGFMYLEPSMRADAKPDKVVSLKGGGSRVSWTFGANNRMWISCGYGGKNEITLSKPLPSNITACTVTYSKNSKSSFDDIDIDCKTN